VAQLEQILTKAHVAHKSDVEVVHQIGTMELSERLTEARLELLTKNLAEGPQTTQALRLLADQSAFLDPPASELPAIAPPNDTEKQRMLDAAQNYVAQALPRLPNFLATRTTNYFDDSPQQLGKNAWPIRAGLHLVGTSSREVSIRDDQNALATTASAKSSARQVPPENVMTSWGEFGSILAMIFGDVANGKVNWSHWEQNAGSAVAVFNYSVPKTASHYVVVGSVAQRAPVEDSVHSPIGLQQGLDVSRTKPYRITPGYHGSLWLDPATGTILRVTIETDLKDRDQVKRADALVQYGPVTIGDHIFICPVCSLTLHLDPIDPNDISGAAPLLKLNETQFINYHRFASTARILTGEPPESASSAPGDSGPPESVPQVSAPFNSDTVAGAEPTIVTHVESAAPEVATPTPTTTVLQVNTNLVLEDVVVTDKGKPVHGLDRSRFHVLEEGREQRIVTFDEHKPATAPAPAASIATLPSNTYSNLPAYPESSALNVLLLDTLNTPEPDMRDVQRKVAEYLGKSRPGASFAVFLLSSRLRILVGFTSNIAELSQALKKKQESTTINSEMDKPAQEQYNNASPAMGGAPSRSKPQAAIVLLQMRQAIEQYAAIHTDQRVQMTLDALQKLARYLSAIPSRKNLIWFSASFPIALFPVKIDGLYGPPNRTGSVKQTCDLLSAARVAVYPVDARGLITDRSFEIEGDTGSLPGQPSQAGKDAAAIHDNQKIAGRSPNQDPIFSGQTEQLGADHDSMQQIAEATGGRAFVNTNGLKEAVASAVEDGVSYYTVGYKPSKQPDGLFRKIQLSIDNAKYNLAYRRGYYADAVDKPSAHNPEDTSVLLAATQFGAPPSTQILFQVRALPANDPLLEGLKLPDGPAGEMSAALKGRTQRTIVDITLDPHNLAFEESSDGMRKAQIEFTLVAYDANGKRVNYTDQGTIFNLNSEGYARMLDANTKIPHQIALDLPAGQTFLRIVIYDLAAARIGSLEVPVTIAGR
jgi:VWFA-related protein